MSHQSRRGQLIANQPSGGQGNVNRSVVSQPTTEPPAVNQIEANQTSTSQISRSQPGDVSKNDRQGLRIDQSNITQSEGVQDSFNETLCEVCGDHVDGQRMVRWVRCDECEKWFHFRCVNLESIGEDEPWSCPGCKSKDNRTSIEKAEERLRRKRISRLSSNVIIIEDVSVKSSNSSLFPPVYNLEQSDEARSTSSEEQSPIIFETSADVHASDRSKIVTSSRHEHIDPEKSDHFSVTYTRSGRSGTSLSSQRLQMLEQQKLEEELKLQEKLDEEKMALKLEVLRLREYREKMFLERKYNSLKDSQVGSSKGGVSNEGSISRSSRKSHATETSERVTEWIKSQQKQPDISQSSMTKNDPWEVDLSIPVNAKELRNVREHLSKMYSSGPTNLEKNEAEYQQTFNPSAPNFPPKQPANEPMLDQDFDNLNRRSGKIESTRVTFTNPVTDSQDTRNLNHLNRDSMDGHQKSYNPNHKFYQPMFELPRIPETARLQKSGQKDYRSTHQSREQIKNQESVQQDYRSTHQSREQIKAQESVQQDYSSTHQSREQIKNQESVQQDYRSTHQSREQVKAQESVQQDYSSTRQNREQTQNQESIQQDYGSTRRNGEPARGKGNIFQSRESIQQDHGYMLHGQGPTQNQRTGDQGQVTVNRNTRPTFQYQIPTFQSQASVFQNPRISLQSQPSERNQRPEKPGQRSTFQSQGPRISLQSQPSERNQRPEKPGQRSTFQSQGPTFQNKRISLQSQPSERNQRPENQDQGTILQNKESTSQDQGSNQEYSFQKQEPVFQNQEPMIQNQEPMFQNQVPTIQNSSHDLGQIYQQQNSSRVFTHQNQTLMNQGHSQPLQQHPNAQSMNFNGSRNQIGNDISLSEAIRRGARRPLTADQIASRHVVVKRLPNFFGDPKEWPGFIQKFISTTLSCGFDNTENSDRLSECLKGNAKDIVKSQLLMPECVLWIMETLKQKFGRDELVIKTILTEIRAEPSIRADKLEALSNFGYKVQNACQTIQKLKMHFYLYNPELVRELVDKLPSTIRIDWARYSEDLQEITLATLSDWLVKLSRSLNRITTPELSMSTSNDKRSEKKPERSKGTYVNAHDDNENSEKTYTCEVCSKDCRNILDCPQFKKLTVEEKWKFVYGHKKVCRTCLKKHGRKCTSTKQCGVNGCTFRHHSVLHDHKRHVKDNSTSQPKSPNTERTTTAKGKSSNGSSQERCNAHRGGQSVMYKIIPVKISHNNKLICSYAYMDDGSGLTLMEGSLADELDLKGTPESLCLRWTSGTVRHEKESMKVVVHISGDDDLHKYQMRNVRTVKSLDLPMQTINRKYLTEKYPYLSAIPFEEFESRPRILIGLDHIKLGVSRELVEGSWNESIASKTLLGWVIHGPDGIPSSSQGQHMQHHVMSISCNECSCQADRDDEIHKQIEEFFSLENFGTRAITDNAESKEIQRAKRIMEETVIRKNGRFEIGLLWKYDDVKMPDNYRMALKRLECQDRRMQANPLLMEKINSQIKDFITKGYARKLSANEIHTKDPHTMYLPVFHHLDPKKPEKVRMVWDGAARYEGVSLNSMLLSGPDNLVLLRPGHGVYYRNVSHCV